ncbi:hypothetical protein GGR56DRAFT_672296 [Xylariaceae sp. FL0804]|nr:hypothetical protein GGR56DRAFT_672296 [Xylariaceae sp. FL0804]
MRNGNSRFECWSLSTTLVSSGQPGVVGGLAAFLGDVSNLTYNVIPPGFDGGFHAAPSNQWGVLLAGKAVLTVADGSTHTVTPGDMSMLFVADTAGDGVSVGGHDSSYPGPTETVLLQIPTADGGPPAHDVLRDGAPCVADDFAALR